MENITESKQIISEAKNIYLIPSKEPGGNCRYVGSFLYFKRIGQKCKPYNRNPARDFEIFNPFVRFCFLPKKLCAVHTK